MNTAELERLWATRPVRPESGRTVAGVCAGFAARYRVDPTLVKVAFVVATLFGGSGLLLYLASWIALPGQRNATSKADAGGRHGKHSKLALGIVLAIIVITSFGPNQTWSSGGIVGAVLMLLGWWLLYRRTPLPPAGTSIDTVATSGFERWIPRSAYAGAATTMRSAPAAQTAENEPADTTPVDAVPPAWDPLGAARFAWDLPEPSTPTPPPDRRRRSPLTLIVVGLAVIVGAGGAAAHYAGADWFTPGRILSMALVVIAGGLLLTSLQRRRGGGEHHTGLVPIAVALSAAVIVTSLVSGIHAIPSGGMGERRITPISAADIQPEYSLSVGSIKLDLTEVTLDEDKRVVVENGMGEIKIRVPETMNVRAECSADIGDASCPDGLSGGSDGTAGPVLTIIARAKVGDVEVTR